MPRTVPTYGHQEWNDLYFGSIFRALERLGIEKESQEEIDRIVSQLPHEEMLASAAEAIVPKLRADIPSLLHHLRQGDKLIANSLSAVWGGADNLYRAVSYLAYELGAMVTNSPEDSAALRALLGVHARAVRTASEIRLLAMNGFAAGAEGRARSLHELAVISCVIGDAPESVAERYLAYARIERYEDAREYQRCAPVLGRRPLPAEDMARWEQELAAIIGIHGEGMTRPNGWALPLFPDKGAKPRFRITFAELEALAEMSHLRLFYKLGNHHVHAGPRAGELNIMELDGVRRLTPGATVFADLVDICDVAVSRILLVTATLVRRAHEESEETNIGLGLGLRALQQLQTDAASAYESAWQRALNLGWVVADEEEGEEPRG